jgi:hypothetical protein
MKVTTDARSSVSALLPLYSPSDLNVYYAEAVGDSKGHHTRWDHLIELFYPQIEARPDYSIWLPNRKIGRLCGSFVQVKAVLRSVQAGNSCPGK